jgi:hypothetical protein
MNEFNLDRLKQSPDYCKVKEILNLLVECRDAIPSISMTAARLNGIDLSLADRIDKCLKPWQIKK